MIKTIIYRRSMKECELRHRKLRLNRRECIFLYGQLFCKHFQELIRGRWREVMIDKTIKLDGITEEQFKQLYEML